MTVDALATADAITADDGAGHAGTSTAFDVIAGPPVAVVFTAAPATLAVGTCATATVALRDSMQFPAPAAAPVSVELQSSPPGGVAFHAGTGACNSPVTAITVAAGASTASFRFVASSAGPAAIRVVPSGLPSATHALTVTP